MNLPDPSHHVPVILCAMEEEAEAFTSLARENHSVATYGKSQWHYLCFGNADCILGITGIGLTNAAAATAIAISQLMPPYIVYAGTAGGLAENISVKDVVCGSDYIYGAADATAFGYKRGQIPQMPERYQAEQVLIDIASEIQGVRTGSVVSSDSFVTSANVAEFREAFPGALSVDMESCAAAQICYTYGVPFVSIRGVSDLCSPDGAEVFHVNTNVAAEVSAQAVIKVMEAAHKRREKVSYLA